MQKNPKAQQLALPLEVPPVLSVKPFSGSASGLSVAGGSSPLEVGDQVLLTDGRRGAVTEVRSKFFLMRDGSGLVAATESHVVEVLKASPQVSRVGTSGAAFGA